MSLPGHAEFGTVAWEIWNGQFVQHPIPVNCPSGHSLGKNGRNRTTRRKNKDILVVENLLRDWRENIQK